MFKNNLGPEMTFTTIFQHCFSILMTYYKDYKHIYVLKAQPLTIERNANDNCANK